MTSSPARLVSLFFVVSVGVLAGPATPSTSGEGVSRADLRPFVFSAKSKYVLGEPVFLRVVLANASEKNTFEVQGYWHPANDFEIKFGRARDMPRRFTAGVKDRLVPAVTYKIRPMTLIAQRWMLCYDPDRPTGFAFDEPGVYAIQSRVQVMVNGAPQDLNLGLIKIEITQPTPEQEQVRKLVMRPECASDLQGRRASDETLAIWQQVAREHPKSVWGPYAKLLLAWHAWYNSTEDYTKIADRFEAITRDYPDFELLDGAYYGCAAAYDRAGQNLKALDWLNRLQRTFPTTPHLREGDRLFRKYIYRERWDAQYAPWYLKE